VKKLKDVVSVAKAVVSAAATTVDVATAVANNGAFGVVVPPSLLTKDEGAYIGASVAFDSACVSVFADGTGQLGEDDNVESAARWGTMTAAPVDSIVAGEAIVVFVIIVVIAVVFVIIAVVVVVISRDMAAE